MDGKVKETTGALTLEMVKIAEIKMLPSNAKILSRQHIDKIDRLQLLIKFKKELKMSDEFKPGDVVLHKATLKRCVVKEVYAGEVIVTTEDDKVERYLAIELEPYREPYIT